MALDGLVDLPRLGFRRLKPGTIALADHARDAGQWEHAARLYRKALDRNPRNAAIWVQYGHALKESGELRNPEKLGQAEMAYRRAVSLDLSVADTYLQLGHALKLQGKTEEAAASYLRACALDPSMPHPLQELSGLGWSEDQMAELRGLVGSSSTPPPTSTPKATSRADVHTGASGSPGGSNPPRRGLIGRRPGTIALADRARDAKEWVRAARLYRKALNRNPRNPGIWVQYGHALKESGELRNPEKLGQAEMAYRRAVSLDPSVADTYLQLGHALKLQGKTEEAAASYLRACALDPSMPHPLQELSGLGWSEVHASELRGMLRSGASDPPIPTPEDITLEKHSTAAASTTALGGDSKIIRDVHNGSAAAVREPDVEPDDPADDPQSYANWVRLYDTIDDDDREAIAKAINEMADRPLISVIVPVYNTPEPYLRAAIDSVRQQLYPNWELCIADDASTAPHVRALLEHYRVSDMRIKVCYRDENGHISAASNSALALAEGSFVALLDHDDVLPEHALYMVATVLNADPGIDLIYSDEDKIDANSRRYHPYFKSDWNPDLMLSQNMFCHLGVYRRSLIEKIGGFRLGYEGSQDYDLVLRAQDLTTSNRIHHIPHVLYHWRVVPGQASVALDSDEKPFALESARKAITDHLVECGITAEVSASPCPYWHRVRYVLPDPAPRVTIVIPTRDRVDLLRPCVESLLQRTTYPDFEILIVDNKSQEPATEVYFDEARGDPRIRILSHDAPYNYSAINNYAVTQATGTLICLLNNDTEVITHDWLTEMASHAVRPEIGAVGALLYYPDDRIQHGGVIVGRAGLGVAWHAHLGLPRGDFGYLGRAALVQNVSAVTAACLVMRKTVFDEVGGLNEKNLAVAYSDVDLCLRLGEAGYRIVWTPHAELYHHESASRGSDSDPVNVDRFKAETGYMLRRWNHILDRDPYFNPNLQLHGIFGLAFPPRIAKPWRCGGTDRDTALRTVESEFDPQFYLAKYSDVRAAGLEPLRHFVDFGWKEGRDPNPRFSTAYYLRCNPDVRSSGINPLLHYVISGRAEGRLPSSPIQGYRGHRIPYDISDHNPVLRLPVQTGRDKGHCLKTSTRLAVHIHVFYLDCLPQILHHVKAIPEEFDIYISTDKQSNLPRIENMLKNLLVGRRSEIRLCPNRGRDIAPFLISFRDVFKNYEYLLHVHTKKSIEKPDLGRQWMAHVLENLLHDSRYIRAILTLLDQERRCGMVIPAPPDEIRFFMTWGRNYEIACRFLKTLGLDFEVLDAFPLCFPAGNMFWCRPAAFERIFRTEQLSFMDFPEEPITDDGTLAHALERLLPYVSYYDGFHYRVVEPLPAERMPSPRADYFVTVVVPAFNAGAWLHHAIQSVLLQEPATPPAEIIIVDNDSNDETAEICRFYSQTFSNVRYFHEGIRGAGAARNLGVRNAQGKYVFFLDADDMMALDCLGRLSALAIDTDADLVTSPLCIFTESHISPPGPTFVGGLISIGQIVNGERIPSRDSPEWNDVEEIFGDFGPCAKLYKRAFLQENQIQFPAETNYEDNLFVFKAYLSAAFIAVHPRPTYFYRRYVNNLGKTQSTVLSNAIIADQIRVLHQILDLIEPTFSPFMGNLIRRKILKKVAWHFETETPIADYLLANKEEVRRLFERAGLAGLLSQWPEETHIHDRLEKIAHLLGEMRALH